MKKNAIKKSVIILLVMMMTTMLFTGCGDGEATLDGSSASDQKVFQIALTAPFSGFDPMKTNDSASTYVNAQIYETLYRIDPVTGEYFCLLAEDFPEFSEDGLTATIKLKEGINFHDGTPFNAEAVKYCFDLIKNPEFPAGRASIVASMENIEVVDDSTLKISLAYEDGVLLAKLAHTNAAIVSPTAQQNQDLMIDPVGTGPYKFGSTVSGSSVTLTRNDEYWGEAPAIKDVVMTIIAEESTAVARMETGEADFMPKLSVEQVGRVEGMSNVTVATSEAAQVYYFGLRAESYINPIMANKEFRTALQMGIDSEGFVEHMMDGYAQPANSIIGPNVFGYTPEVEADAIAYDPEGAKAILDAHPGWADEEISFLVSSTPIYMKIGEYMQSTLTQAGFNNIVIEPIDWSAWLTETKTENRHDVTLAAWSNVTRDGTELMEPNFHSEVGQGRVRAAADVAGIIDQAIIDSKTTSDASVRTEKLQEVNRLLIQEGVVQPILHSTNLFCFNSAYENVTLDAGGTFYVKDFIIK